MWQAGLKYYLFQVSVDRTGGWARREAFGARSDLGDFVEEKGEEREEQGTQSHGWPEQYRGLGCGGLHDWDPKGELEA